MSLKAFHILFVVAASSLSIGFGVWAIQQYRVGEASRMDLSFGIASLLVGIALIVYGKYFLKKLKHISYL